MKKAIDLTEGSITRTMLSFAVPMIVGNLLQQFYNVADTLIVGQFLGKDALAAVGSAYTLMIFLTSVLLGLCLGSGAVFSHRYGAKQIGILKKSIYVSFVWISATTLILNIAIFIWINPIIRLLQVPAELYSLMYDYLWVIFWGIGFTFLYNFYASLMRAIGNSMIPLWFLAIAVILNIILDFLFILVFDWGVKGAGWATVISQGVSGVGLCLYAFWKFPELRIRRKDMRMEWKTVREIAGLSFLTCVQQSVMNFGILMVQGLVNSFGAGIMAAFAAAVKIDSFAYMPVQDFGNAFSTFIAQNFGARKSERIRQGIRSAVITTISFCVVISAGVILFARPLMLIFVQPHETEIISIGIQYLHIEGTFYFGIGCLFLLYGFYRAVRKPGMSVVLTFISLGTRVVLAYALAAIPSVGVTGIWWAIPIGWILADTVGLLYYRKIRRDHRFLPEAVGSV